MKLRAGYNPLLKSYTDSERINRCTLGAEVFYVRLLAQSDDAGQYWGEPAIILARLFTHRMIAGEVSIEMITCWLAELERERLIEFYKVDGRTYLRMVDVFKTLRKDVKPNIIFPSPFTGGPGADQPRPEPVTDSARTRPKFEPLDPETDPHHTQTHTNTPASLGEGEADTRDAGEVVSPALPPPTAPAKPGTCSNLQAREIYEAYPRKVDPEAAMKAIKAAVKRLARDGNADPVSYLLARTRAFASSPAGQKPKAGEQDYRKHPRTWFTAGSYANVIDPPEDNPWGHAPRFDAQGIELPPPKSVDDDAITLFGADTTFVEYTDPKEVKRV